MQYYLWQLFLNSDIITLHQFFIDEPLESLKLPLVPSKVCKKCGVLKPLEEFSKSKTGKFGRTSKCKCCMKETNTIYYAKNAEELCAKQAIYRAENKEEINAKQAIYRAENKEEIAAKQAINYQENKEERCAKQGIYDATPENKARANEREAERKATDPLYKLKCNIRSRIGQNLKNGNFNKDSKTADILGCSFEEFQIHIENQFQPNMTWQNQGEWHYDHFFPISWAVNEAQSLLLNSYTNLRPLWAEDNMFKKAKAPYTINESTGEISILLECDRDYILNNIEKLEVFLEEFNDLA